MGRPRDALGVANPKVNPFLRTLPRMTLFTLKPVQSFPKVAATLAVWVLSLSLGWGQVRINNRSFEVSESLPTATGQFGLLETWGNAGSQLASPDFYHTAGEGAGDLPQTPLAKVNPFEGDALAGFIAYTEEAVSRHEYIVGSFSNPLEVGKEYRMTFMLTSGRVHDWVNAGLGVSGLGIHCSVTPPNQEGYEQLLLPTQFTIEEAFYDRNWREVAFVFRAEEPFQHFTFGLFGGDPTVRREEVGSRDMAYYFVDRFTIQPYMPELALEGEQGVQPLPEETELEGLFIPNAFTPDGDALNDDWHWSMPEGVTAEVLIFNRTGHAVWSGQMASSFDHGWTGTLPSGATCEPGVYPWTAIIMDANGDRMDKRRGFVAVIL